MFVWFLALHGVGLHTRRACIARSNNVGGFVARPEKNILVRIRTKVWARHVEAAAHRIPAAGPIAAFWDGHVRTRGVPVRWVVARLAHALDISYDESNPSRYLQRAKQGMEPSIQGRKVPIAEAAVQIGKMPGLEGTSVWYTSPLWDLLQEELTHSRSLSKEVDRALHAIGFERLRVDELYLETRPDRKSVV